MTLYEMLLNLKARPGHYDQRLYAQLSFANNFDEAYQCGFGEAIFQQAKLAVARDHADEASVAAMESALAPLGERIKELTVLAVSHAHIDMNWMWRYDETVAITLSTFRTILDLMKEYPDFTFSQSQASVYKIVEKYDPDMLDEIRQRVSEGRWELAVSSWVETDKNMPGAENLCRHILYAKAYMQELFGVNPDDLKLDFEPDTFGHNANVPMILNAGGVQYYYHCRGYEGHHIYRWQCCDHEVLTYREPVWYNFAITHEDFLYMPKFAKENGITTLLKVYGVGDHGGGPTRRDLNRLTDMMTWPLLPTLRFGTYREFYAHLETHRQSFPVVTGELNAFATGCFTTQTRIKRFNKLCERQLYEAETLDALSHMQGNIRREGTTFREGWEHVLFNTFHDILPGSGVIDTREHALGRYQECLGITNARKRQSLSDLASLIDTSAYDFPVDADSTSEGAGVGFCLTAGVFSSTDRNNNGKNRIYHLFNTTAYDYATPSTITLWDYPGDLNDVDVTINGQKISWQLMDKHRIFYWGHEYQRISVDAFVPAFGYTTVVIRPRTAGSIPYPFPREPRLDYEDQFVLENEHIRVELDAVDCAIRRLTDKHTGKDLLHGNGACFQLITEDASKEMTAWIVGRYTNVENIHQNVIVRPYEYIRGELVQSLTYRIDFHHSHLTVTVRLEKNSPMVTFRCSCDFGEKPVPHQTVPQLAVSIPCHVQDDQYLADIPFGHLRRNTKELDLPCQNGVWVNTGEGNLFVISSSKYGFRVNRQGVLIDLIRGSYEPDPLPDFGISEFDFAIGTAESEEMWDQAIALYNHPCADVPVQGNAGVLPETGSLMQLSGAQITALKLSEDKKAYILRLHQCHDGASITLPFPIRSAALCDLHERPHTSLPHSDHQINLPHADGVITLRIEKE